MTIAFAYDGNWQAIAELASRRLWEKNLQGVFYNFQSFVQRHKDQIIDGITQASSSSQRRAFFVDLFDDDCPDWTPQIAIRLVRQICDGMQPVVKITAVGQMR